MAADASQREAGEWSDGAEASTATARVYATLRERIAQGRLPPGTRLVRRRLAEELGVSTIPVMEALRRLERDGLVEHETYSKTRVRRLTEARIREDTELREAIESQVARLCARCCTDADLNRLYYLAGRVDGVMGEAKQQLQQAMRMHMDFHMTLAHCAGCALLADELEKLWLREMMLFCWLSAHLKPVPPNWHRSLVDAIGSRDEQLADEKAREHTRYGLETFLAHLREGRLNPKELRNARPRS
jgi:DNA-binding GntR family transcriptional regulator